MSKFIDKKIPFARSVLTVYFNSLVFSFSLSSYYVVFAVIVVFCCNRCMLAMYIKRLLFDATACGPLLHTVFVLLCCCIVVEVCMRYCFIPIRLCFLEFLSCELRKMCFSIRCYCCCYYHWFICSILVWFMIDSLLAILLLTHPSLNICCVESFCMRNALWWCVSRLSCRLIQLI